jgi:predicted molibdopterin-dependent oxidoreductase YjgC
MIAGQSNAHLAGRVVLPLARSPLARRVGRRDAREIVLRIDGREIRAREGETVAAALLTTGKRDFRTSERWQEPRGYFCGMGICFECLVSIDGRPNQRACQVQVAPGMEISTMPPPGLQGLAP